MKKTKAATQRTVRPLSRVNDDFKNALLIVSLFINLFVFTTWLVAKASPTLAAQLGHLLN
ncbi:MAG: hypothetical protein WAU02_04625 [Candidatus Saccharimonadales bacterium]